MKHLKSALIITFLFAATFVYAQQAPVTAANTMDINGKLWASLWQQKAAEYRALCFQAYNIAHLRADQAVLKSSTKPKVIITDIDETLLDNSPNAVSQALKGRNYEQAAWLNWTSKAAADTVPGAPAFLKYAAKKGITIYYITNRSEAERASTLKNLQKYGFPNADDAHLLLRGNTPSKEERRRQVMKDNEVIMLLGDNLADFSALFDHKTVAERLQNTEAEAAQFGNKFIVLPNADYGDWESALYDYKYNLTPEQKEAILKKGLKGE
ncbi:5'-nucleotidase, lipoprotein e(P4) family [Mucilaginibacter sp. PPCGB 2223]|uniref:5'-nucleotidase, lipoprotein e(P4) family n=1 Tax=Mucilaginibacter sp. PPCGB 2223 TaxID=1886027 RepID=UPI000824BDDE|nr:5'-nucleotidase, lipoprotein e(P4) family [Mucilaginibacter sp. PPCGB 2223]OCX52593.1 5'-nucleotidase, lipoprotein e(P4) family [Mucilaginibacter sp. PPCGB 2223]